MDRSFTLQVQDFKSDMEVFDEHSKDRVSKVFIGREIAKVDNNLEGTWEDIAIDVDALELMELEVGKS